MQLESSDERNKLAMMKSSKKSESKSKVKAIKSKLKTKSANFGSYLGSKSLNPF